MFKVSSPCLIFIEAVSFGVVHFLSLAGIFVFEFGFFFLGNLGLYECPKGHRTTLAAKKEEAEFETKDSSQA